MVYLRLDRLCFLEFLFTSPYIICKSQNDHNYTGFHQIILCILGFIEIQVFTNTDKLGFTN